MSPSNDNDNNNDNNSEEKKSVKILLKRSEFDKSKVVAKLSSKASKILQAFCSARKVDPREYRLIKNGKVLESARSLEDCGIADGDVLEVVASQTGGNK